MKLIKLNKLNSISILLFLLPNLTIWKIHFIGELMLSDIIVFMIAPILILNRKVKLQNIYIKRIFFLLLLWFFAAILSDIVNGSSIKNMLRGLSAIIFFSLHLFIFFRLINGKKERYMIAILGVATSYLLRWVSGNSIFSSQDITSTPWKMGVGFSITILFIYIIKKIIKNERIIGGLIMISSPIHLILNARSLFLTVLLASLSTIYRLRIYSKKKQKIFIFISIFFIIIAEPLAISMYGKLNEAGIFGVEAQQKYMQQTAGGKVNVVLGGRSESLVSFIAIADSPLVGHGSWAESKYYYNLYLKEIEALGKKINWEYEKQKDRFLIPSHSMLFGTWVYHGVIGAFFWIYILYLSLKAIKKGIFREKKISIIEFLILYALVWDIFFSPFGQARRCIEAVYIVVVSIIAIDFKKIKKENIK